MDNAAEFKDNDEDNKSNSDEDERRFLERFLKKCKQHRNRKKVNQCSRIGSSTTNQ